MTIEHLATQFIDDGRYLRGWSEKTIRTYQQSIATLRRAGVEDITQSSLQAFVVWMREHGLTPGGCNVRIRTVNSFLSWLHEEQHTPQRLRLRILRSRHSVVTPFDDADVRRLVVFRPHGYAHTRAHVLVLLLLDTGLRIDEAIGLERQRVNLDSRTVTVLGKGSRERVVPMSIDMRKHLFRWLSRSSAGTWAFSTQDGERLAYRNVARDIKKVAALAGVTGRVHPHRFRHAFAVNYIRRGGDIYRLSRILGHSTISTTQLYLRSMGVEHLREGHEKYSPLGRL